VRYVVVETEYCKGCGLCISACPKHIVGLSEELSSRGHHTAVLTDAENCTGCCFCAQVCPDAAIEVKSSLNKSELDDLFKKSISLRSMNYNANNPAVTSPLVTAFAYECRNLNLSLSDFATFFAYALDRSPSLICVLNRDLFGWSFLSLAVD